MRFLFLIFFVTSFLMASAQKTTSFVSIGADYRQYPIDIEDLPRGPLPNDKGLPSDDTKFWQAVSLGGHYGIKSEKNWLLSIGVNGRYNLLHRLQNINLTSNYPKNIRKKTTLKFDIFLDIEKKIQLKKNIERYFFIIGGIGFTNINSRFDITLTDTSEYGPFPSHRYQGNFCHFGPRISVGYQSHKIKTSLDAYLIEGPTLNQLTSLWLGASVNYELILKKRKK